MYSLLAVTSQPMQSSSNRIAAAYKHIEEEPHNQTCVTKKDNRSNLVVSNSFHKANRGFSLVELMLVISILGIMFALATPDLELYLINQKIRASATSIQSGLQLARSEAVKRNLPVSFVLTKAVPTTCSVKPAADGTNWVVRVEGCTDPTRDFLQGRSGKEGTTNVTVLAQVSGANFSNAVIFNGIGRLGITPPLKADIQVDVQSPGGDRPLRVLVTAGGQIRLCDPSLPTTNLQSCKHT